MENSLSLDAGVGDKKLILCFKMMLIFLRDKYVFIFYAKEYVAKLHPDTFRTALYERCKLL